MQKHVHKLLFPLLLAAGAGTALAAAPPVPDLAWWAGEGNTLDSASNNTGTAIGNVQYAPGVVGQCFDLTGQGFIRVTNCPAMQPATSFTISAWAKAVTPGDLPLYHLEAASVGCLDLCILLGAKRRPSRVS